MAEFLNPLESLEIVLAGAVATTALPCTANYVDIQDSDQSVVAVGDADGAATGTGTLTLVSAPSSGRHRAIKSVTVYNADTTGSTVTVRKNNGTTTRIFVKPLLGAGDTLMGTSND